MTGVPVEFVVYCHVQFCELHAFWRKAAYPKETHGDESTCRLGDFYNDLPWLARHLHPRGCG